MEWPTQQTTGVSDDQESESNSEYAPTSLFDFLTIPLPQFCSMLETDLDKGLTTDQAEAFLLREGPNSFAWPIVPLPFFLSLITKNFISRASVLSSAGIILCLLANTLQETTSTSNGNRHYVSRFFFKRHWGLVLAAVCFLTGSALASMLHRNAVKHVRDALTLQYRVSVVRDGKTVTIGSDELCIGDLVEITMGDYIPADLRITKSNGLTVNNYLINGGDSTPVVRNVKPLPLANLLKEENIAFFATHVVTGSGMGIVIQRGEDLTSYRIFKHLFESTNGTTSITRKAQVFFFLAATIFLTALGGLSVLLGSSITGYSWSQSIYYQAPFLGVITLLVAEMWNVSVKVTNCESPVTICSRSSNLPAFSKGDVLFLVNNHPVTDGDDVVFKVNGCSTVGRVVAYDEDENGANKVLTIYTSTDNKKLKVNAEDIVGRIKWSIRHIGTALTIIKNVMVVVIVLALGIGGSIGVSNTRNYVLQGRKGFYTLNASKVV